MNIDVEQCLEELEIISLFIHTEQTFRASDVESRPVQLQYAFQMG